MIILRNKFQIEKLRDCIKIGFTVKKITKHIYLVRTYSTKYKKHSIYILCLNFSGVEI